jgi:hypothetical protein
MKIFSIYDQKAGAYMLPFYKNESAIAQREFQFAANDFRSVISKCPEDFTLFELGEFDEKTGNLMQTEGRSLGNGIEFVDKELQQKINFDLEINQ